MKCSFCVKWFEVAMIVRFVNIGGDHQIFLNCAIHSLPLKHIDGLSSLRKKKEYKK